MEYYTKNPLIEYDSDWVILPFRSFYEQYLSTWKMTYKTARLKLLKGDFPVITYQTSDRGNYSVGFLQKRIKTDLITEFRVKQ